MHSTLRNCVLRFVVVAGATAGVILVAIAVTRPRTSPLRTLCWPRGLVGGGCSRNLQVARYPQSNGQSGTPFYAENHGWPRHKHHTRHGHHDNESDDDDSEENNDDDSEEDSENSSQSGSSDQESAAVQSSIITNLDGVNIGNTITIINIGTGSQASGSGSDDVNKLKFKSSGSFSVSEGGRSAVTSAAVRAFCDSIGCNPFPLKGAKSTVTSSATLPIVPAVSGSKPARGNEVQYELPVQTSDSSVMTRRIAKWMLFIAIVVQLV